MGNYKVEKIKCNNRYEVRAANVESPNKTLTSSDFMKPWVKNEDANSVLSSGTDEYQDGRM